MLNYTSTPSDPRTAQNLGVFGAAQRPGKSSASGEDQDIFKMVKKALNRLRKQVTDYNAALLLAENVDRPRRGRLHELYLDFARDAHFESVMETRRTALSQNKFVLVSMADSKPDEKASRLLEQQWVLDYMDFFVEARAYGTTLVESKFMPMPEDYNSGGLRLPVVVECVNVVDRRHVEPMSGMVLEEAGGDKGVYYRDVAEAIQIGKNGDLGFLHKVVFWLIYKRNVMGAWVDFTQKFGMPLRVGKTNTNNAESMGRLERAMKEFGSAAWAVIDADESIDFVESTKGDAYKVYDMFLERANSEISKLVLGVTMLSDQGSSKSQSETHRETFDMRARRDRQEFQHHFNDHIRRLLILKGYPLKGLVGQWDVPSDLPLTDQWTVDKEIHQEFGLDPEYIARKYNVPIVGKKEEPAPKPGEPAPKPPKQEPPKPEPPPGQDDQATDTPENRFQKLFNWIIGKKPEGQWRPAYATALKCCGHAPEVKALDDSAIETLFEAILIDLHSGKAKKGQASPEYLLNVAKQLMQGLEGGYAQPRERGTWDTTDHAAIAFMRGNVFAFSAAKSFAQLADASALLVGPDGNTRSFGDFRQAVDDAGIFQNYNRNWLQTEYSHAVAAGQMASKWNDAQELASRTGETVYLTYRTAGDDRVRAEHAAMDGIKLPMDDPFWEKFYPPNGGKCRCDAVATLDADGVSDPDAAGKLGAAANVPKYFRSNVGQNGVVFPAGESYFGRAKDVFGLKAVQNYGMRPKKQIYADPSKLSAYRGTIASEQDYEQWWSRMEAAHGNGTKGEFVLRDVIGMPALFDRNFKSHPFDTAKRRAEQRWLFHDELSNMMADPDEVWLQLHPKGNYQLAYIRYYQNKPLCLSVGYRYGEQPRAFSLFALDHQDALENTRIGVPMHKK